MATFADGWLMVLGVSLIFFELLMGAATGFELFILGWSFIASGAVYAATGDWQYSILTSLIVLMIYWYFLRNVIRRGMYLFFQRMGIDTLVGKEGIVAGRGMVMVAGDLWKSNSKHSLKDGTRVVVEAFTDNKLAVVPR